MKELELKLVFTSIVGGAIKGVTSLLGGIDNLGSAIEKLNSKKVKLFEDSNRYKKGLIAAENELKRLEKLKDKLNLELKITTDSSKIERLQRELKSVDLRIAKVSKRRLEITQKFEDLNKKIESSDKKILHLGKSIEKLNGLKVKIEGIEAKREKFKSKLFDTVAIGATVAFPIKKAIEFESAMADVVKVANLSKDETLKFGNALQELSTKIPIAADGLASIAASGAQLGISKDKLIDFTKVVAKMSTAFDMSANEAGDSVAKLMNVYGLSLSEVTKLGDALNHLSDNTAAKAKDMIEVLSRIGGTAKMFGLSSKEASALSDAFLAMGKPPEVAATAINALLTKLNTADKQGKKFQDGLRALGLNSVKIKMAIKNDPQKAIMMVLESLKRLDKQAQMGVLTDMFGAEYSDDIALLVSGLENYKKALRLTANESDYLGSMQKEFENRSATTANKLQLLGNSLTKIGIALGSVVLPPLQVGAEYLAKFFNGIAKLNEEFPILGKVISYGGVALGSFVVSSALFGYIGSFIVGGITKLRIGFTLLGATLDIVSLKTKLLSLWQGVLSAKTLLLSGVTSVYGLVSSSLSATLGVLGGAFRMAGAGALWLGRALMANPIGLLITGFAALVAGVVYAYNKFDWFRNGIHKAWEFIKKVFSYSPLGLIVKAWGKAFDWLESKFAWFRKIVGGIKSFFGFGDDEKKDEEKKPLQKIGQSAKKVVTATAIGATLATAQPVAKNVPAWAQKSPARYLKWEQNQERKKKLISSDTKTTNIDEVLNKKVQKSESTTTSQKEPSSKNIVQNSHHYTIN
ncbi:MAG TPA: phage tail tape measure protein, partial [Campylobacterales bacterium]|nr:phage tail tape measure protein [Campylobacterales bacterium]